MNSNYINLQKDSEFSGGNVNKVYDWLHNLPIEEQEKLSELSYGEVIKEYQKTQPIQEDVWDKTWEDYQISTYYDYNGVYGGYLKYLEQHYTLIKK